LKKMDSKTIMTGLFGNPVAHSMSPVMHNAAFEHLGLPFAYAAFSVAPDQLGQAVEGIRALGFRGINVTIPHKVAIMSYLDRVDPEAAQIGAVNTVIQENGELVGYNTDGQGYVRSLIEELDFSATGKRIVILGAGGAAKAVGVSLALRGAKQITIVNRTLSKAEELAEQLSVNSTSEAITFDTLTREYLRDSDLLINTTSVGMYPNVDQTPISMDYIHPELIVSDLIYNPLETKLLYEAKKNGAIVHNGAGMFIHQGALAFERWTGQKAPIEVMQKVVMRCLSKSKK
jgi:shikimate dehydrogenase